MKCQDFNRVTDCFTVCSRLHILTRCKKISWKQEENNFVFFPSQRGAIFEKVFIKMSIFYSKIEISVTINM